MTFTYKELIDVAIGTPESGHVNFYALHVLLTCFAQRLDVLDEMVEQGDYMVANVSLQSSVLTLRNSSKFRLFAGADAEGAAAEPVAEAPAEQAPEVVEAPAPAATPPPPTEDQAPAAEAPPEPEPVAPEPEAAADPVPTQEEPQVSAPEAAPESQPEAALAKTPSQASAPAPGSAPGSEPPSAPGSARQSATSNPAPASQQASAHPSAQGSAHGSAGASQHATRAPSDEKFEKGQKSPDTSALVSRVSSHSNPRPEGSLVSNVMRIEKRLSKMEMHKEQATLEVQQFVTSLTGQLRITMEQVNNVTHLLLDRKPNPERIKVLRNIAKQLRVLMATTGDEVSISWTSEDIVGVEEEEALAEEEELHETSTEKEAEKAEEDQELGLEPSVCYTPDKMLTELLDLKSQFCALTNTVNDLAAALMRQDSQRLMDMIRELQETVRDIKVFLASSHEDMANMSVRMNDALTQIGLLKKASAHLDEVKMDKEEAILLLAEKVDFQQLATKVSLEQLEEYKARLEKMFCEMRHIINLNEKNVLQIIDNLRQTLGVDALELSLRDFRDVIERRVHLIAEALQKYMEMTNDDCAAAAGRVKVLQDLSCLSCDTTCVMRTVERSKVPSLPNAKASTGLGPLVTYELGQIRKSGIMGYYRKDEFPHSASAWAKGTDVPMVKCTARHAGGDHTTHTPSEHMQKVILSKKNTGWK